VYYVGIIRLFLEYYVGIIRLFLEYYVGIIRLFLEYYVGIIMLLMRLDNRNQISLRDEALIIKLKHPQLTLRFLILSAISISMS
jgi:hypothetical protein